MYQFLSRLLGYALLLSAPSLLAEEPKTTPEEKASKTHLDTLLDGVPTDKPMSTEEFIENLPAPLLRDYALMTESLSRHKGDKENPRVITFTPGPEPLIVAFSGNAKDPNYRTVELMQFRKSPPRWELRMIEFPEPGSKAPPKVSPANPQLCKGCHDGFQPRFSFYPQWKGSVGEHIATLNPTEKDYLQNFVTKGENHPRYKYLKRKENLEDSLKTAAPFRLDKVIDEAGSKIVANAITKTKYYDQFKYAYLAAIYKCPKLWEMVPKEIDLGGQKGYQAQVDALTEKMKATKSKQAERALEYTKLGIEATAGLRYFMTPLGVSLKERGRYQGDDNDLPDLLSNTEMGTHAIADELWINDKELFEYRTSTEIQQYLAFGEDFKKDRYIPYNEKEAKRAKPYAEKLCAGLKEKSLAVLKDFTLPTSAPYMETADVPVRHTDQSEASDVRFVLPDASIPAE
jgi:hypothetical protein